LDGKIRDWEKNRLKQKCQGAVTPNIYGRQEKDKSEVINRKKTKKKKKNKKNAEEAHRKGKKEPHQWLVNKS